MGIGVESARKLAGAAVFAALAFSATPTRAGLPESCVGDCGGDGRVTVSELVTGVNVALGAALVTACEDMDRNRDQRVTVDELVQAVNALLRGCPPPASATPTLAPPLPTATLAPPSPTATLDLPSPTPTLELPSPTIASPSPTLTVEVPSATPVSTPSATSTPELPTPTATIETTPSLLAMLKQGGFVIHWRHSAATVCQDCLAAGKADNPTIPDWWKSCEAICPENPVECTTAGLATARQLDATGVMEATTIGEFFDEQAIPIGRVLSSEYCRCFGTAELMDFGPAIEQRSDITYAVYDEDNRCASSMALIAEVPSAGTNTAIIGHAGFATTCPILGGLAWSEAAIFKPDGEGGSTLITRVLWDDWRSLP